MIKQLLGWIDQHPTAYWLPAYASLAVLLILALRPTSDDGKNERAWLWALTLIGVIVAWRWPFFFCADELNPDEAQWTAGALTLWLKDPVFGRAVDGTTSGPLNFYALWYAPLLGLPIDFFSARLLAALLAGGAVFCASQALRVFFEPRLARITVLPAALFFAFNTKHQLIHYASEYVSLFLTSLGVWRLLRAAQTWREGRSAALAWACAGLALGLAPWAKFQAAVIAAPLILLGLVLIVWLRRTAVATEARSSGKAALALCAGALAPSALALVLVMMTGVTEAFYNGYVLYGRYYLQTGSPVSPWELAWQHWTQVDGVALFQPLFGGLAISGAAAAGFACWVRWRPGFASVTAWVFLAASVAAVLSPQRPFMHYMLYLPVPATLAVGMFLGEVRRAGSGRRGMGVAFAAAGLVALLPLMVQQLALPGPFMLGRLQQHWREPRTDLGRALRPLVAKGEPLAVWGWRARTYLENGNVQATRCAHSERMILDSPLRDYHRQRYLADFRASAPRVFVDATGPGAYEYEDRGCFGHEIFPELRVLIAAEFRLAADLGHARLYVRRETSP